ncbi:MAG: hypothetical protein RLZZ187_1399 [Pseudomonadota bacterium]|jgi:CheY-like chemotaxis protein
MPTSEFQIINEDFEIELAAIIELVKNFAGKGQSPKISIAAANSSTLLLAATFEEFVRDMARTYARAVVTNATSLDKLPKNLASTAWKRSLESLARVKFDIEQAAREKLTIDAQARFAVVFEFIKGDLSKDIYNDLIHNENNMRPAQINSLFKISGLQDICKSISDKEDILSFFGEIESGKAHGKMLNGINDFFERRNGIAHALNIRQSSGPDKIITDLEMLRAFGVALYKTLDALAPSPATAIAAGTAPVQPADPTQAALQG